MALEPFLVNPPSRARRPLLAFGLNPRRKKKRGGPKKGITPAHLKKFLFKKGRKSLKKKRRAIPAQVQEKELQTMKAKRNRRGRFVRRSKSHRRNPIVLGSNPRRKRRSSRRRRNPIVLGANPRRRRSSFRRSRRSYRRNPNIVRKFGLPSVSTMLWLGAGAFTGRLVIPQVLARLPILSANPVIRGVSRLALVAVGGFAAKMALGSKAENFTLGLLANQVPEVVNDFLSLTGVKLADGNSELDYNQVPGMGFYTAPTQEQTGLSLYTDEGAGRMI